MTTLEQENAVLRAKVEKWQKEAEELRAALNVSVDLMRISIKAREFLQAENEMLKKEIIENT